MSAILSRIYNSAPTDDAELLLAEFNCAAWSAPIRLAVSSRDETVTLPGGAEATFRESGLSVNLPDQKAGGAQDLAFSIGGATVEVMESIDASIAADEPVFVTLYVYTWLHRSAPQKTPLTLQVVSVVADDESIQCAARMRDIINSRWPKVRYTPDSAPGLKYFS